MARPRNHVKHIAASVETLLTAVTGLIDGLRTTVASGREVGTAVRGVKTAAKGTGKKIGAKVKAAWARYTPAQRAARIAKMKAGHAKRKRKMARA